MVQRTCGDCQNRWGACFSLGAKPLHASFLSVDSPPSFPIPPFLLKRDLFSVKRRPEAPFRIFPTIHTSLLEYSCRLRRLLKYCLLLRGIKLFTRVATKDRPTEAYPRAGPQHHAITPNQATRSPHSKLCLLLGSAHQIKVFSAAEDPHVMLHFSKSQFSTESARQCKNSDHLLLFVFSPVSSP